MCAKSIYICAHINALCIFVHFCMGAFDLVSEKETEARREGGRGSAEKELREREREKRERGRKLMAKRHCYKRGIEQFLLNA